MPKFPLVSVIIPVYNGARFLAETIQSVTSQDYENLEILVVDDGSNDDSSAIAGSFPTVRVLVRNNRGVADARNTGVSAARGSLIAFLDQDDLWLSKKISLQAAYLITHPECDVVFSHYIHFKQNGSEPPGWVLDRLIRTQATAGENLGTMLCRREVFECVGMFDSTYTYSSDADWFFRLKDHGVTIGVQNEVLMHKRMHDQNDSYKTAIIKREMLAVMHRSVMRKKRKADASNERNPS